MGALYSDFSRHSLPALLGGCVTRFAQTYSPPISVGLPRRRTREGQIFNVAAFIPNISFELAFIEVTHTIWKRTIEFNGEVAEWFKAAVSKTAILIFRDRGFESHPLRQWSSVRYWNALSSLLYTLSLIPQEIRK